MTPEEMLKNLIRDVEKLKEATTSQDSIDEILILSETITLSDSVVVDNSLTSHELSSSFSLGDTLDPVSTQLAGTFLVGTAVVGFADCA